MERNNIYLKVQNYYVGIDVHLNRWVVTILSEDHELRTFSQNPDPEALISYLKRNYPNGTFHLVYEAGFCGFGPYRKFVEAGLEAMVVHPGSLPTTQKEKQHKSDSVDSRKLAKLLRGKLLSPIHVPSLQLEAVRDLARMRETLKKELAAWKNRVKSLLMKLSIPIPELLQGSPSRQFSRTYEAWLKDLDGLQVNHRIVLDGQIEHVKDLKEKIKKVNKKLKEVGLKYYGEDIEILQSIPGFGWLTAINLRAQWGDMERFKRLDDLCSYMGVVPSLHASGEQEKVGRMVKRGRGHLKANLIETAWRAIQKDPELHNRYYKYRKRMIKNKAIIKIVRILLSRARALLQNRELYQLNYNR